MFFTCKNFAFRFYLEKNILLQEMVVVRGRGDLKSDFKKILKVKICF